MNGKYYNYNRNGTYEYIELYYFLQSLLITGDC
jgi:hypothetical protein